MRNRVGLTDGAATRIPEAAPLDRGQVRFRTLLFRYLAVGFILLATVVVANPGAPDAAADPDPWDYQREQVDVQGRGALNAYGRTAIRATAWLAKSSIERQRDMLRLGLFDVLVGAGAADSIGGWRSRYAPMLEAATKAALLGLIAWGVVRRPAWRHLTVAALLLLVATAVVTRPYTTVELAARPGVVVPNAMLAVVSRWRPTVPSATGVTPSRPSGGCSPATGSPTSPTPCPGCRRARRAGRRHPGQEAGRAGVAAQERVGGQRLGRRAPGPERAFIATSALGYVLPFAVGLGALAMVAACAQTLLFVLCLGGLFALPLAAAGRRQRRLLVRFLVAPLLGSVAVLAGASLLSFVLVRAAETLHASDEYVGLLLAGSTWPALAAFLIGRWLTRRRQGPGLPPPGLAPAANGPRS